MQASQFHTIQNIIQAFNRPKTWRNNFKSLKPSFPYLA